MFDSILICDDDDIARFINRTILESMKLGDRIDEVTDGTEALNYLLEKLNNTSKKSPSLILLDLNMPCLSGLEVLQQISKNPGWHKKLKIVVLTSSINSRDLDKALTHNIRCYLTKPLTEEKIRKALVRVTKRKRKKTTTLQPQKI